MGKHNPGQQCLTENRAMIQRYSCSASSWPLKSCARGNGGWGQGYIRASDRMNEQGEQVLVATVEIHMDHTNMHVACPTYHRLEIAATISQPGEYFPKPHEQRSRH